MEIALYIRKEYFRGVTLTDKSAHILEFHYEGEHVDVFENVGHHHSASPTSSHVRFLTEITPYPQR